MMMMMMMMMMTTTTMIARVLLLALLLSKLSEQARVFNPESVDPTLQCGTNLVRADRTEEKEEGGEEEATGLLHAHHFDLAHSSAESGS